MTKSDRIGMELLKRLLAGERGDLAVSLALLLERSSKLRDHDNTYRALLHKDLAELRLSAKASQEILGALCDEIVRNPDRSFITAIAFTGSERGTRAVLRAVTSPPRPMSLWEYDAALGLLGTFLPIEISNNPGFATIEELSHLIDLAKKLERVENIEGEEGMCISLRMGADNLIQALEPFMPDAKRD